MTAATRPIVTGYPSTMGDDAQLNTTTLIRHAARTHGEREIVFRTPDGDWDRYTYADAYARVQRGANALRGLGVQPGDRVGILDWNSRRHFELYWAIPGIAACMVQLNLRLSPPDLTYVLSDSGTSVVLVDETLLPLAEAIAPNLPGVKEWVVMTDKPLSEITTSLEHVRHFEDLLDAAEETIDWPEVDEKSAYGACYTTGTTGRPKGVYYSHRAICLHSYGLATNVGMTLEDCTILITPMFHGQAWGLPQAATLTANKIVLPGRYVAEDTAPLTDAIIAEGVTIANGAPAIFLPMLRYIETLDDKPDLSRLRMMSGATEPPLSMMRGFRDLTGAEVVHAYGATETTPMVTVNRYKPSVRERLSDDELFELKRKQGFPVTGVDIRLVDELGEDAAWDGVTPGEICVRGPWITTSYHGMSAEDSADRFLDGWWRSGDVGTIDPDAYLKVTDRLKDVIKSGGEWISSIDMENLLLSHPAVAEAAVVGLQHPQWQERPFVLVAPKQGAEITLEEIREHLSSAFAKWQLPEALEIVSQIPKTSVGKFDKKVIRADYADVYGGATAGELGPGQGRGARAVTSLDHLMSRVRAGETVVIDGATGTECERRGVPKLDPAWNGGAALSHPDVVREVHRDYLAAGAQLIIANTFATHKHVLEAAGVAEDFVAYNQRGVELAVEARAAAGADGVVVAAGISNWTWAGEHPSLEVLRRNSAEQAAAMKDGGAELLMLEMMINIDRMKATLDGARTSGLPIWVGFTCGPGPGAPSADDGVVRLRDGEPLADAIRALDGYDIGAITIMHTDVELIDDCLDVALDVWSGVLGVYAHSGENVGGDWVFDRVTSPADYRSYARRWSGRGVSVIGGCCGIGPEHIRELASLR